MTTTAKLLQKTKKGLSGPLNFSEVQVSYRPKLPTSQLPKVTCSVESYEYLKTVWSERIHHVEEAYLLLLNRSNKILGYYRLSVGGISGTVVDSKLVFQIALSGNASSVILAHSHPSGNLKPSDADIQLTKRLVGAGKFLELPVLDHLIMTAEGYTSFADEGLI